MAAEDDTPGKGKASADIGGRRDKSPVTIDLTAEARAASPAQEGTAPGASGAEHAGASDPAEPGPGETPALQVGGTAPERKGLAAAVGLVLAGAVGGAVVFALGYAMQLTGALPSPGQTEAAQASAAAAALSDTLSTLDERVTRMEAARAQAIADRALLDDLSRQVGVVDAFGTSLSDRLLNAEAAIAALEEEAGGASGVDASPRIDELSERIQRLEAAGPAPGDGDPADGDGFAGRIEALEAGLARLEATAVVPAGAGARSLPARTDAAAGGAAIAALREAAAQGGPFVAGLAGLDDGGVDAAALAALRPLAEKGAPSRADLIAAFPKVAEAIVEAQSEPDADGGIIDRVVSYGRNLVKVRPAGSQAGEAPNAVVARMRAAVAAGDLAGALAARDALPPQGQAASQAWAAGVADRLEIERLIDEIAAAANADGSGG